MSQIEKIMVVGAGQMGSGIAQVAAQVGISVILNDTSEAYAQRGFNTIAKNLEKNVIKGRISKNEKDEILNRISLSTNLSDAKLADLIIEAATENKEIKLNIFRDLDDHASERAILATNTSSLPITEIAASTNRPEKVIGMHFMNPVPIMQLVEIIRGLATNDATYTTIYELAQKMNKVAVEVSDYPGFVANRILIPMINEAIYCVYEGVSSPEEIDQVMKLGMNHPMGPLTLADFIGLDTCLAIMEVIYNGFGDSKYRPCPLLRKYVNAGWLGKKSGRGFYEYKN